MASNTKWKDLTEESRPPPKIAPGTLGRPIKLMSNFFPLSTKSLNKKIVQYDVTIKSTKGPVTLPKPKNMRIFEKMKETYPELFNNVNIAYDRQKSAYSINPIKQFKKGKFDYKVKLDDKDEFILNIQVVSEYNLQDLLKVFKYDIPPNQRTQHQVVFQALEVMFAHFPSNRFERIGRNMFFPTNDEFGRACDIGGGKQVVTGFFSSLRPAVWKDGSIFLNIDVANAAFYKVQPVLDLLKELLNYRDNDLQGPLDFSSQKKLMKDLKDLKVQVSHTLQKRTYKVRGIANQGARKQTFTITNPDTRQEETTTVEQYFLEKYKYRLRFPNLNVLQVGPQNRNVFLPIECCTVVKGQKVRKKLSDYEVAQMIRSSAKTPYDRMATIKKISQTCDFSKDPFLRALEFTVSDQVMAFNGRVLPAPNVLMDKESQPKRGVWDYRDHTFYVGAELQNWFVFNYDPRSVNKSSLNRFIELIQKLARERGMKKVSPPMGVRDFPSPRPEDDFHQVKQRFPDVRLVLVILPKFGNLYHKVKRIGDREVSVLTQCVKSANANKGDIAMVSNLLLKMNAKLDGINNVLGQRSQPVVFTEPVMIMGADVNHPPIGVTSTPSLAAVVGSIDRFASQYSVEVRHQRHHTEMIQQMKDMTKNLLMAFYQRTARKPKRIIMFRDGVGESQFLEVLLFEMKAMREACTELEKGYTPAFTFIVVQKRHHTRLFCTDDRDGEGRNKNIPAGTTVDSYITHPTERDFYLCSHQGIQGTSRPTHYHVLWDDSDFNMNELQTLTYAMCHLYSRCSRSVSIPAPAYYAHLAAFRAKVHIHDLVVGSDSSSSMSGESVVSDAEINQAVRMEKGNPIHNKLYFV